MPNEFESDQLLQNTSSKFLLHDYIPQPERHEKTDQLNAQVQKNSTLYIICVSVNGKGQCSGYAQCMQNVQFRLNYTYLHIVVLFRSHQWFSKNGTIKEVPNGIFKHEKL